MTEPASQISISDGTTTVNVSGYATLGLQQGFSPVPGGSSVTRFLDGTAIKQTSWTGKKWQIRIRGEGWAPSGLWDLDYSQELTFTIWDHAGPTAYTCFAEPPEENWDVNQARADWTLTGEEK